MPRWYRLVCLSLGALVTFGCASTGSDRPLHEDLLPGTWHIVRAGETSSAIAQNAGIPLEDFLEINGLRRADKLVPGRPVFILADPSTSVTPPGGGPSPGAPPPPAVPLADSEPPDRRAGPAPLRWPVRGPRLTSRFGTRWGRIHEGIDMAAPIGTPVLAAASGTVIYAGDQVRGYGNMVVLRHPNDLVTVYAHNSLLLVHTGDEVTVGQEIARVGDTGRSTAPHLHFEVRRNETPQDPMPFLPPLK
jgi:lipoprotein NlpD